MTLEEFVNSARLGKVKTASGGVINGMAVEGKAPLKTDAESITAEAYNAGVLGETDGWDTSLATVRRLLG